MLLATAFIATTCLAAPQLNIEDVAPEQTVLVVSLDDMGAMLDRLKSMPAGDDLSFLDDMKEEMLDDLPDSMSDTWESALEDSSMDEILGSLQLGMAIYPVVDPETTAVTIGYTLYLNLGEAKESVGAIWDQAMEDAENKDSENFETIEIAETDVIRIQTPPEEDEDDDPFGGGGMGMGMDFDSAGPDRYYLVRVDEHIMTSSSRSQMARMLDVLAGREIDGGLGESDIWKGVTSYIGDEGLRMVVLTDHLGEFMQAFGQPFIVNMMKPMVVAMFGKIEALGGSLQAAKEPALASFKLGAWIPEGKSGLMKLMDRNTPREPIPGWVTAETVKYARLNFDFEGVLPWIKTVINSNPMLAMQAGQFMEQVEPMMEKVMSGMGNMVQMTDSISYPINSESLNNLWSIPAKDPKAFTDAMAEIAPQMGFEARDFQGHQIYSMDTGGMMGGMSGGLGEIAVAVGGGEIFMGTLPSVEQSLRSVGGRASEDSAVAKKFATLVQMFSSDPVVYWSVADMGAQMVAEAEVANMQWSTELERLQDEDPELAGELAEMMGDEDELKLFRSLADWIGLAGYEIMSVEDGFKGQGWILEAEEE
ncbi:MAG: hypothetical protein VX527_05955 [Planctomycetota bacterium]|nr:hypothetical protein [Planctomycetota bacterium]